MARSKKNNYKFVAVRCFNWDNVLNDKKQYRQVFDKSELSYLGVELNVLNKKFDEENWEAKITFKAYEYENDKKGEEKCTIEETYKFDTSEMETFFSKGWGNDKKGSFWEAGSYIWDVYVEDDLVGSQKFFVEDVGLVNSSENPYFEFVSLKLYEGPNEDVPESDRLYMKSFNTENTRYIFGELKFNDKVHRQWLCELFFNIFDDTGTLIGQIPVKSTIMGEVNESATFTLTQGWGSQEFNNWKIDDYTLEVNFQENLIAVKAFSVTESDQEEISDDTSYNSHEGASDEDPYLEDAKSTHEKIVKQMDKNALKKAFAELDALIGLDTIKAQVHEHIKYVEFLQLRKKEGIEDEDEIKLHSVFTGNPGTGKTTVVKLLGKIYKGMGLLSKGHVHTVDSSDLVSGYVRQTGKTTQEAIEKARGGILFIDEAYMLYRKGIDNDFGTEAIAELITEMSDGKGDIAIMFAGYPKEMEEMISSNPGLKSRIKHHYTFPDYTPGELLKIADYAADKRKVQLTKKAKELLKLHLTRAYRDRDHLFGNGRLVNGIIEDAKINMGVRVVSKMDDKDINKTLVSTIEEVDVQQVFKERTRDIVDIPIDKEVLDEALDELDKLLGLEEIKQEIKNTVKLVKYYREINRDIRRSFQLHSVFTGNPGTGKTTVARIMGKIYKGLGILERGHLVETDSGDLIAGYLGQTAEKTKKRITEAMGGVLFIDEAYSLTDGNHPDFGKKAVATLLKQMEDKRGEFAVIVAGYTKPMQNFIESNPGLKSRFDQTMVFDDFSAEDLYKIAVLMIEANSLKVDKAALDHIKEYLEFLYSTRNQFFGNARSVRKIIERIVRNQNLRMASMKPEERTEEAIKTIVLDDVKEFVANPTLTSSGIGFKFGK